MGLFRKSPVEPEPVLTEAEAVAGVAISAIYSDAVLEAAEFEELDLFLSHARLFASFSPEDLQLLLRRLQQFAIREGADALLARSCKALPERLRPTAYFLAVDLLMADETVGHEETGFLENLEAILGLDHETSRRLREAARVKHAV